MRNKKTLRKEAIFPVFTVMMTNLAFLLMGCFVCFSEMVNAERGLQVMLPPKMDEDDNTIGCFRNSSNYLSFHADAENRYHLSPRYGHSYSQLVDKEDISSYIRIFVMNNDEDEDFSESPQEAIVSISASRGASYQAYFELHKQIRLGYDNLRAEYLGMSLEKYLDLERRNPRHFLLDSVKKIIPYRVGDAEVRN